MTHRLGHEVDMTKQALRRASSACQESVEASQGTGFSVDFTSALPASRPLSKAVARLLRMLAVGHPTLETDSQVLTPWLCSHLAAAPPF